MTKKKIIINKISRPIVENKVFAELYTINVNHYLNFVIRMSKAPWSLNGRATALRAVSLRRLSGFNSQPGRRQFLNDA